MGRGKALKWAEVNQDRVVISTGTINLQQQLMEKDIPLAKKILGCDVKTVLVKGRGNYICHKRFYAQLEDDSLFRPEDHQLNQLKEWINISKSGSLSDLNFVPDRDIWSSICSEAETCTGIKCAHFGKCFSMKARFGALTKLDRYIDDGATVGDVVPIIEKIKESAETLDQLCLDFTGGDSLHVEGPETDSLTFGILNPSLKLQTSILDLTTELGSMLKSVDEEFHDYDPYIEVRRLKTQLESLATFFEKFRSYNEYDDDVFWVEKSKTSKGDYFVKYSITPLDISSLMTKAVFEPYSSVICTSATLTVNDSFQFWKNRVGIGYIDKERVMERLYPSPFDYENRVFLGVPTDIPLPNESGYLEYTMDYIEKILTLTQGSGLVLFTSYSMLREVYDHIRPILDRMNITSYRQGEDDRSRLLNNFKENISSVLFATESFWQGVDSPGDTLKVVIIAKLPFRVPSEPIIKARMERCKERGGNPFMEISIPDAVTRLKQGFGRLMRRKSDWGMVYILDSRSVKKRYGSLFLNSLPQCRFIAESGENILSSAKYFLNEGVDIE
ncbi:MAG: hypothetical protein B6229_05975 [Spirochaetaceae bacterium 4572_7]|nr:MAG: hypothetical protein B6229_05975 [Spirochaetaceae bacterium 4572_7]